MPRDGKGRVREWLEHAPGIAFSAYAIGAAFMCYFCMYAFRKPFTVAEFANEEGLKASIVVSQIFGYAVSKFIGIKVCSEIRHERRAVALVVLIAVAEAALLLFAVVPSALKIWVISVNGLALGMVWGMVVGYLEGRRLSDLLMSGLCCSFIIASGVVKDTGRLVMTDYGVTESWMPAVTGALYLVPFLASVWMLEQLPGPSPDDAAARTRREPMFSRERVRFMREYAFGFGLAIFVYMLLTAVRDIRDNFGIEIFRELGYADEPALFTKTETPIAFAVVLPMALLTAVKDNRKGLLLSYGVMIFGTVLLLASTALFDAGMVSGLWWMILVGLGAYLAYVPYNAVLFERMIATTQVVGTAVFCIYVADAAGYLTSISFMKLKDAGMSWLPFYRLLTYGAGAVSIACLILSGLYFARRTRSAN